MRLPNQRQTPEEKDRAVLPSANSQGIASGIASYGNVSRGTALTLRFGRPRRKTRRLRRHRPWISVREPREV